MYCSIMDSNCTQITPVMTNHLIDVSIALCVVVIPIMAYSLYKDFKIISNKKNFWTILLNVLAGYCIGNFIGMLLMFIGHYNPTLYDVSEYNKVLINYVNTSSDKNIVFYHMLVLMIGLFLFWVGNVMERESIKLIESEDPKHKELSEKGLVHCHRYHMLGLIVFSLNINPLFFMVFL